MKKILLLLFSILLLFVISGCGNNQETASPETNNKNEAKQEDQVDPTEQYKQEAKSVSYEAIINGDVAEGTKIVFEGDVTYAEETDDSGNISQSVTFTLSKNSDGSEVYWVKNASDTKFGLNSKVKVYGTYDGPEKETEIPQVNGEIIEVIDDDVLAESESELAQKEAMMMKTGEYVDPDIGKVKVVGVGYNDEVGIDGTDAPIKPIQMGSMNLYINQLHVLEIEPTESSKTFFNDQDKVRAVVVDMKAENTSEQDISFHPNQSIIVTDTGEQVESEMFLMGEAGGDFLGKVTKEGQTWWLLKNLDPDIKSLKLIISPPHTTDGYEDQGEEKRLEFEILNWEQAKERDKAE